MNIKIGAKIKELRKRNNITQEQLSEALGVTNQAISRWESESGYPDIEYIVPIADFFKVTANYLLDNDKNNSLLRIDENLDVNEQKSCSFCGKGQWKLKKLVAGPAVNICNECVLLCVDLLMNNP